MGDQTFAGKVALVTGGSRGIGRAVCEALGRAGARVAVNYARDEAAAEATCETVRAGGGSSRAFRADVSDPQAVAGMVADVEAALGPVDMLVTSAGVASMQEHTALEFAEWQRLMRVNVDGTFLPVMAVKDGMIARGDGRIVCIASIAGLRARGRMIAYSASKAAVIGFARSCAEAFGPAVRVNTVAPGLVETDMTAEMDDSVKKRMCDEAFLKRVGTPQNIADATLFLLSDKASFISGQTYVVDGGRATLP